MNKKNRQQCSKCLMHPTGCYCEALSIIPCETKTSIIMHNRETHLLSNTARLVSQVLGNSEVIIRGKPNEKIIDTFSFAENKRHLYLYPYPEAEVLNETWVENNPGPFHLIVPDGNWRQARKTRKRETIFHDVRLIKILPNEVSNFPLRGQHHEFGLCTLEAIAHALFFLAKENGAVIKNHLLKMLAIHVQQNLKSRHGELGTVRRPPQVT